MNFEIKIEYDVALAEMQALLDKKKLYPKKRAGAMPIIEMIAEAMSYGHVSINGDGGIVQTLLDPIKNTAGGVEFSELTYKARVAPDTIASKLSVVKNITEDKKIMVYTTAYTGKSEGEINKLESTDRNTCDAISLFFML